MCSHLWAVPDSKVHGANMGPTWVLSAPDGPHVGPMNLAIRDMFGQCLTDNIKQDVYRFACKRRLRCVSPNTLLYLPPGVCHIGCCLETYYCIWKSVAPMPLFAFCWQKWSKQLGIHGRISQRVYGLMIWIREKASDHMSQNCGIIWSLESYLKQRELPQYSIYDIILYNGRRPSVHQRANDMEWVAMEFTLM